ncbi:unnamed protein product [Didymodactylos carnosus]|uniref:Cation efflux protein transmembrane domain-containing protein n=1 Tax=Didymodactylos carnosus TaxID=1234261 RepID=A0A815B0V0_9BILA|nr:unnamed protein product [Didymodactylos carnosus]CAF1264116.1 unnamed protein product [Didymodactylos carnosus]CAF3732698.1 unnamed protein product [Didymodactylos carnosus]CAF4044909.1 unnamed protein product [Didymodactylos carnosus]
MTETIYRRLKWKSTRIAIMLVVTFALASIEFIYGLCLRSPLLISNGLFSYAESLALIGSLIVLRYTNHHRRRTTKHKGNTFGYQRLELLTGLLQEIFLISLCLSIIIDSINRLIYAQHNLNDHLRAIIVLGSVGIFIGLLGIFMFHSYRHDHSIENEIKQQQNQLSGDGHDDNDNRHEYEEEEEKEELKIYATLHALSLHSFVSPYI